MVNSKIAVQNQKKELDEEYNQLTPKLKLIQQKNKELISEVNFCFYSVLINFDYRYFPLMKYFLNLFGRLLFSHTFGGGGEEINKIKYLCLV